MYIFAIEGLTPSHPSRWTFEEEYELLSCLLLLLLLRLRTRRTIRNSLPISLSVYLERVVAIECGSYNIK